MFCFSKIAHARYGVNTELCGVNAVMWRKYGAVWRNGLPSMSMKFFKCCSPEKECQCVNTEKFRANLEANAEAKVTLQ